MSTWPLEALQAALLEDVSDQTGPEIQNESRSARAFPATQFRDFPLAVQIAKHGTSDQNALNNRNSLRENRPTQAIYIPLTEANQTLMHEVLFNSGKIHARSSHDGPRDGPQIVLRAGKSS
jgi:hypothetical protein